MEAVRCVARGDGDILVKGLLPSADLLRAVLSKSNGLATGRTLSHVGVFKFAESDRFYFVTDAALSIAPDYAQKIDIVQNAVDLAHKLGIAQPIVAILCAIETVNPEMPATVDAASLSKMAERGAIRGARVEGPLALDNAVSVEAARHKGITSELAGPGRHPGRPEHRGGEHPLQGPDLLRQGRGGGDRHGRAGALRAGLPQRLGAQQAVLAGPWRVGRWVPARANCGAVQLWKSWWLTR